MWKLLIPLLLFATFFVPSTYAKNVSLLYANSDAYYDVDATYWMAVYQVDGEYALELAGPINVVSIPGIPFALIAPQLSRSDYEIRLQVALQKIPQRKNFSIILSSPGGSIAIVKSIVSVLRNKCNINGEKICNITIYVPGFHECASACIGLFSKAGDSRIAGPSAAFGFHAAADMETSKPMNISASIQAYLDFGVSPTWLKQIASHGALQRLEMTWYQNQDIEGAKIVDTFLNQELPLFNQINNFWKQDRLVAADRAKSYQKLKIFR